MLKPQSIRESLKKKSVRVNVKTTRSPFAEKLIFVGAVTTILIMLIFIYTIFSGALPVFFREGLGFITGNVWDYSTNQYGISIFIVGTLIITMVTMLIACPLSILTAIFLAEFAPPHVRNVMRPMVELLIGIPSVVYGVFGIKYVSGFFVTTVKPFLGSTLGFIPFFANLHPYSGDSVLLASTVLAIMILPTITVLSIEAMSSVPTEYLDSSIALGATKWETVRKVVLPVAMPGIITGILMGLMRAMGETMAIVMLTGNVYHIPGSITDTAYSMTSKILNDITFYYGLDTPRSALMGIALVLFIIEFILLLSTKAIGARLR